MVVLGHDGAHIRFDVWRRSTAGPDPAVVMMHNGGRPQRLPGTHGALVPKKTANGRWRVDARGSDGDGIVRRIQVTEDSPATAITAWARKFYSNSGRADSVTDLTANTLFETVARLWVTLRMEEAHAPGGRVRVQTVEQDLRLLRVDVVPVIGQLRLRDLTTPLLEQWLASIRGADGAEHSLNDKRRKCRSLVKRILDYAIRMGAIEGVNVAERTTVPPKRRSQPRALSTDEIHALRDAARRWRADSARRLGPAPSLNLAVLVDLLLGSGMRIGEALALRWGNVHLATGPGERSTVTVVATMVQVGYQSVRQEVTKSERGMRSITVPPFTVESLRLLRPDNADPDDPVFRTRVGTHWQTQNARRSLKQALEAAGIDPRSLHPHTLRATVATALRAGGYEVATAAAVLGNTEAVTANYYIEGVHTAPDVLGVLQDIVEQADPPKDDA
ncbi:MULTISPECIES: tyrosine-type recombinase/integrase [Oerskovia]|uniref:Site-specific integrase n=1 Tax=Oerskovia rustica TaxID=2762237 RepID=A0ABR8RVA8_9CELL|nr:site-specific integrase [Oerskovia rustica]MBD7951688.1 site-specific integrase [Oerskovia rustica]